MASLLTETEVVNRALQRVGAQRIAAGLFRSEDSKNAEEARSCYDMLRRAELRRNVWRFSIRENVIRAIDDDSRTVTFANWAVGTTYSVNHVIMATDGRLYYSKINSNLGNNPTALDFTKWGLYFGTDTAVLHDATKTYSIGELVYVSTTAYLSLDNNNADTPPAATWRTLTSATLGTISFVYPVGSGPISSQTYRNVYKLPTGFLREAPQDPKRGSYLFLGAPSGSAYSDWYYESDYLTSQDPGPIMFRYVAEVQDPREFDPLFAEGLAARVALELSEALTQSVTKTQALSAIYAKFMGEARLVNAIEKGPEESPEDSYITSRY